MKNPNKFVKLDKNKLNRIKVHLESALNEITEKNELVFDLNCTLEKVNMMIEDRERENNLKLS